MDQNKPNQNNEEIIETPDYEKLYKEQLEKNKKVTSINKDLIDKRQSSKLKKQEQIDILNEKIDNMESKHLQQTYGDKWEQAKVYDKKGLSQIEIKKLLDIDKDNQKPKSIVPSVTSSEVKETIVSKPKDETQHLFDTLVNNKK